MSILVRAAIVATVGTMSLSPRLLAHEGHGDPQWHDSLLHYLTEPMHLPLVLAALVALGAAVRWLRRRSAARLTDPV